MRTVSYPALLACGLLQIANASVEKTTAPAEPAIPTLAELEAAGAIVGRIIFDRQNVFDTSQPGENKSIFRLANRWHIMTRESVIEQQLLIHAGEPFSARLIEESERLLRANRYLYDARITPVRYADGIVDLRVWTRDLWTLSPGASVSRSGGENRSGLQLSERNLLGLGIQIQVGYSDNVDRSSTSFEYFDNNLGASRVSALAGFADNSDGGTTQLRLTRPFYAMDARWAAGLSLLDDEREESFYDLGNEAAEYHSLSEVYRAFWGRSRGLIDGWATRWTTGLVYDDRRFATVKDGTMPSLVPLNRKLVYPFLGFEMLQDRFETANNRDQIERTEDFYLGTRIGASLGWASTGLGSDRDAMLYTFSASKGFGTMQEKSLFLAGSASGRVEHGDAVNTEISASVRYYHQITEKRLFFMTLYGTWGDELDLDNLLDLGGDTGLRGYPLRYQTGKSRVLFSMEQRYFTNWYPFHLLRVGGALFADIGRTWGDNPVGGPPHGLLKNVGIGLRLGRTRSSRKDMIHIDIAFPLDGDPSIDSVQFLIESKRSF